MTQQHMAHISFLLVSRTQVLFSVLTDIPALDSGDTYAGFQNHSGQPFLCLAEVYLLYVTCDSPLSGSGVTLANL